MSKGSFEFLQPAAKGNRRGYRRVLGRHFPAMALIVVAGLLGQRARVEIEGTAIIPAK